MGPMRNTFVLPSIGGLEHNKSSVRDFSPSNENGAPEAPRLTALDPRLRGERDGDRGNQSPRGGDGDEEAAVDLSIRGRRVGGRQRNAVLQPRDELTPNNGGSRRRARPGRWLRARNGYRAAGRHRECDGRAIGHLLPPIIEELERNRRTATDRDGSSTDPGTQD